jgi:hypothetical protein
MSDSFAWSAAGGPAGWSDADKYLQLSAANIGETTGVTVLFEELRMSRVLPDPGYTAWAAEWGLAGTNASSTVDVDRDGFDNLLEYALGGNPTNADAIADPAVFPSLGNEWELGISVLCTMNGPMILT